MQDKIRKIISESIDVKKLVLDNDAIIATIETLSRKMVSALKTGSHIYFCGNGGSAADAQHLAAELTGRFYLNRVALPAEALHCNTSYLTAVGNDFGFDVIYARLISGIGKKGDFLVGLSTSGTSPNIVKAFEAAREKGIITVGFTGETGGALKPLSDYLINIPSKNTPRIQECHMLLGHILCELVEEHYKVLHIA